jgi:nitrite reductase/ring-hydroxylating ferredoxin subunit/DMSO/TMAO reductase YedYZ heme-binding membrane subunit
MSATYRPVGWTRNKLVYDAVLLAAIALYLVSYMRLAPSARPADSLLDAQSLAIRAYASCAFILLSLVLMIGPLARLDTRFLPLLYNRRHFGVITCLVAAAHVKAVFDWYLAFSPLDPFVALLVVDNGFGDLRTLPFLPFGMAAFLILLVLAATSHDFWLSFLTPPVWKSLHLMVYAAYGLIILHVGFGSLQDARNPGFTILAGLSVTALFGLHLAAAWRERRKDRAFPPEAADPPWVEIGPPGRIRKGRAITVPLPDGHSVAVFRSGDEISAISNVCAHQNGPLGEGRVIKGKVICPWHGFEYCLRDGRAPPPYTERVATYRLSLIGERLLLDPRPLPAGTDVEPVQLPEGMR